MEEINLDYEDDLSDIDDSAGIPKYPASHSNQCAYKGSWALPGNRTPATIPKQPQLPQSARPTPTSAYKRITPPSGHPVPHKRSRPSAIPAIPLPQQYASGFRGQVKSLMGPFCDREAFCVAIGDSQLRAVNVIPGMCIHVILGSGFTTAAASLAQLGDDHNNDAVERPPGNV